MIDKNILDYDKKLEDLGIEHKILEHPELKTPSETLGYLGLTFADGSSTLIMKTDDEFIALIRRDDCQLDFEKLKKALKAKTVRMANPEEFTRITGLPLGAARVYNPGLRTFLDKKIFDKEYLVGGTGSFTCSIQSKVEDLRKIPQSTIIDVTYVKEKTGRRKRILTGDTPTGKLHLGHVVGTLENRTRLQNEYETFIILADTHALTTLNQDPKIIRQHTMQVLLDNISFGLDPKKVTFFIESEIPELYELASFFSMYVSHNRALRNPTIKDEITMKGLGEHFSLGFINYPIYQAADILCVKGELVPVGKDQEAHLEQAREIAQTFNRLAGKHIFPLPNALIGRLGKLIGTDGNPKMSKSLGNTIFLSDSADEVEKKVMNMYTDPKRIHVTDPGTVEGNPVFVYLDAFGKDMDREKIREYKEKYVKGQVGDIEVKKYLIQILNSFLDPIRKRRKEYDNEEKLLAILRKGNQQVREETKKTLQEVKEALGFMY